MKNKMIVKGNIQTAGIYFLKDAKGEVKYVGSGISIADRLSSHLYYLKRNLYAGTNKQVLQDIYDREELTFEVIKESASNGNITKMTSEEKIALQKALSTLEEMYIKLYEKSICNSQKSVTKHSSNHNSFSTYKRRIANSGEKNPRVVYDEALVSNILYLKQIGIKPKKIIELLLEHDIKVTNAYISRLGVDRWVYLEPLKPEWYDMEDAG